MCGIVVFESICANCCFNSVSIFLIAIGVVLALFVESHMLTRNSTIFITTRLIGFGMFFIVVVVDSSCIKHSFSHSITVFVGARFVSLEVFIEGDFFSRQGLLFVMAFIGNNSLVLEATAIKSYFVISGVVCCTDTRFSPHIITEASIFFQKNGAVFFKIRLAFVTEIIVYKIFSVLCKADALITT